ncbi:hypothetical protein ACPB9E_03040 [Streptomyces exfoliatus]|uniref:hypothetical protein n=1 Tax=Streptomyces exfoliatus TaxID=1905 RepID=UPI003C2EE35D
MTRWNQGRSMVDALFGGGQLERVPASQQAAEAELVRARTHVGSARQLAATDPEGAYAPTVTPQEVAADLAKVEALIELAEKAIPNMPRY